MILTLLKQQKKPLKKMNDLILMFYQFVCGGIFFWCYLYGGIRFKFFPLFGLIFMLLIFNSQHMNNRVNTANTHLSPTPNIFRNIYKAPCPYSFMKIKEFMKRLFARRYIDLAKIKFLEGRGIKALF